MILDMQTLEESFNNRLLDGALWSQFVTLQVLFHPGPRFINMVLRYLLAYIIYSEL